MHTNSTGPGMTAGKTHMRPETLRQQIEQAHRRCPELLRYAVERVAAS